jgi:hypothetical protein
VSNEPPELRLPAGTEGIGLWLKFPETLMAPSPEDRAALHRYRLATSDSYKQALHGRRQLIFELWSIVIGCPPPVPGVHQRNSPLEGELTCVEQAHALFFGIQRPFAEDDEGANVLAYILKPRNVYEYDPNMVSVASKVRVPDDAVFVTYARLECPDDGPAAIRGTITHWGFVEADGADPWLPVNHSSRYRKRLW